MHAGRLREKVVDVARAEYPHHVVPVMRHRTLAFALEALALHVGPVVVRAPGGAAREARLERHRTGREIAAERDSGHADACGVDVVARGEPVVADARP